MQLIVFASIVIYHYMYVVSEHNEKNMRVYF